MASAAALEFAPTQVVERAERMGDLFGAMIELRQSLPDQAVDAPRQ